MFYGIKLKGGALYIALIISVVTGIVLSVFILIAYFNQRQVLSALSLTQLEFNLESGLSMARSGYFSEQQNNRWLALGNGDSLRIKKLQWGGYEIISAETKNRNRCLMKSGLYGVAASSDTALLITDRGRPVGLSGKIKLNGYCYFPKAGIKPAYIEGESFNSEGPLNSFIKEAPMQLPAVKEQLLHSLRTCLEGFNPFTDSLIAALPDRASLAFSVKTGVLQTAVLSLTQQQLSGNIKLVARSVTIHESAALDNILVVAEKVRIKKGFKGSLHILASDSIILEEGCRLSYPSSLCVLNTGKSGAGLKGIFIGGACVVQGALLCLNESTGSKVMVKLSKECEVQGLIYSSNYAHIQGKVCGTALCESLLLTTPSAVYENHLLGCELDPKKFAHILAVPSLFKNNPAYRCGKWL